MSDASGITVCMSHKIAIEAAYKKNPDAHKKEHGIETLRNIILDNCCDLIELMVDCGCDINAFDSGGNPPLMYAVKYNKIDCVKKLLALGSDPYGGSYPAAKMAITVSDEDIALLLLNAAPPETNDRKDEFFLEAVQKSRISVVKYFLEKGYDPNPKGCIGWTPLLAASGQNNLEILEVLFAAGADVNLSGFGGTTPLMRAVELGENDVARWLLDNGADPDLRDDCDKNAFSMISSPSAKEDAELAELLMINKQHIPAVPEYTPLMAAASGRKLSVLVKLMKNPHSINQTDENGFTALHYACKTGSAECIRLLLKNGADANAVTPTGQTSISLVLGGYEKIENCIDELLNFEVDLSIKNINGQYPSEIAATLGKPDLVKIFSTHMKQLGKGRQIEWDSHYAAGCLVKAIFDENRKLEKEYLQSEVLTPEKFIKIVKTNLIRIMFEAVKNGSIKTVVYILDGGADVNMFDGDRNTPLNMAARYSEIEIADLLLKRGADIELPTERGYTPIQFAKTEKMRMFLKKKGALEAEYFM